MTPEQAAKLREPFPPKEVGKLPRVTCKACRDSQQKVCSEHRKQKCEVCGNYMTTAHMHLDYVGHAAITDRLLQVDPEWTWQPMAANSDGFPVMDSQGGLWILLTVGGITRPGYGDPGKIGPKEAIGDALRNAAMRFGAGLDLWSKEDLRSDEPSDSPTTPLPAPADAATEETMRQIGLAYKGLKSIAGEEHAGAALALALEAEGVQRRADLTEEQALVVQSTLEQARLDAAAVPT